MALHGDRSAKRSTWLFQLSATPRSKWLAPFRRRLSSTYKIDLDLAIANFSSGTAQLKALQAAVARSQLNLEYTEIRSPIRGRTGRALVTPGNLVVADTTVLTSVVSMDPIYAYFDVDESSALDYRTRVRGEEVDSARTSRIDISLGLANEEGHPHLGQIDFVDNVTDVGSGNITIRGRFDNADGALLPGLFVRIKVPFTRPYDALLVPQSALAMNQQGRYVLVVEQDNTVKPHIVTVGSINVEGGTQACIEAGLSVVRGKKAISLERQVRIAAGSLVLLGVGLSFVHPYFIGLSAFIGAGLVFAGITDTCGMGMMLAKMPWNK